MLWQPRNAGSVKTEGNMFTFPCVNTFGSGPTSVSLVSFIWVLFVVMLPLTEKNNIASLFPKCNSSKAFSFLLL